MKSALTLIGLAAVLTGCAATQGTHPETVTDFAYDEQRSHALNIAEAAGIDWMEDLPREDYEALVAENPELEAIDPRRVNAGNDAVDLVGASAAGVAGAMDPVMGLGDITSGALGVISWLADGPDIEAQNHIFFWLPEGKTLADAENAYTKAIVHGLGRDMEEMQPFETSDGHGASFTAYRLKGCEVEGDRYHRECVATLLKSMFRMGPDSDRIYRSDFSLSEIPVSKTPFAGDGFTTGRGPIFTEVHPGLYIDIDEAFTPPYYRRLSEALPDWFYIYHARDGGRSLTPKILNAGKAHYFIEPAD
jgi:hypothetical protein